MKTHVFLSAAALIASGAILSGCSGTQQAATGNAYDDVYYRAPEKTAAAQQPAAQPQDYTGNNEASRFEYAQDPGTENRGTTQVTNNYYYDSDDYYDYAYSARLRRFYHPYGWGYYDSYYTNPYWYDYNPSTWGLSIYLGYNWWAPSYMYNSPFSWGISFNYGWPAYGWCGNYWHNWYNPYYPQFPYYGYSPYGFGYGYPGYWNAYNAGYWNGYYNGMYGSYYNPYYYNHYDYNSTSSNYYYGPRRGSGATASTGGPRPSVAQLYQSALPERSQPTVISTVSPAEMAPVRAGTPESPSTAKPVQGGVRQDQGVTAPDQYTPNPRSNTSEGKEPVRSNTVQPEAPVRNNPQQVQPDRPTPRTVVPDQPTAQPPRSNTIEQPDGRPSQSNPVRTQPQQVPDRSNPRTNEEPRQQENYYPSAPQAKPRSEPSRTKPDKRNKSNEYKQPSRKEKPRSYEPPRNNNYNSGSTPRQSTSSPSSRPRSNSESGTGERKRR